MSEKLLEVNKLITSFDTEMGWLRAVDEVSFSLEKGKTLGIVGESGCGKSVTAFSIIRLLPQPVGQILGGDIYFRGENLIKLSDKEMRDVRGDEIGMIFQEPMTALNPCHRIGRQLSEVFLLHTKMSKQEAWDASIDILKKVKIPSPEQRMSEYPHQLSGGMRQRVVIAMALALKPDLLIADEPTTALDVTVQAQILELMQELQEEMGMSIILITHDLAVIAQTCDEVLVMYAGRAVEHAEVHELFNNPLHAYTRGLLDSIPKMDAVAKTKLQTIPGNVASIRDFVRGCRFCQRMGLTPSELKIRPKFIEVSQGHWVETCPRCYGDE